MEGRLMSRRKRVSIQLSREEIARLSEALNEPQDLPLILKLRMAREWFGDHLTQSAA